MPVQDNDDKRTADQPAVDAEEELRKQKARAQEQQQDETSVQKSGKLLPFLNAKAERHQSRIDTLDSKIATQQDKIKTHKSAIQRLSDTADRLEDKNRMLETTLGNLPLVRTFIEKNKKKIADIRENKIPAREQKIKVCEDKIAKHTAKRETIIHKLNRVIALSDAIKSFSIGLNKNRREAFSDAMDRLNEATYHCLTDKKNAMQTKREGLVQKYNAPETSVVDKLKIQEQINNISLRIQDIEKRINDVWQPDEFYFMQDNDTLDAQIELTSEKLADMTKTGTVTVPDLAESTLFSALETEELDKSQIAALADKLKKQQMTDVEVQLEDDYNMIDGIINNGSKEDIGKAKAELAEGIKSMESLADNPFVSEEVRASAADELAKMKKQLELLSASDEVFVESWLDTMVDRGAAEYTQDGGFKVNPDYYKELPRNDRHVETMIEIQAVEVMSALTDAGIQFSAATKGEDKVGITVSKNDVPALNDVMYASIGKIAHTEAAKENGGKGEKGKYQTINPEYYASLGKDDKHTRVEPIGTARKIVAELQKQNIPYSAVVRKNDTVAVTVSKANA
ncbi:MAG: DUF4316 domain-containing protein [Ruminococcus sp.]|nr:DUF4316 domain-containing protein [Ruminococcus sp.]